MRKIGPEAMFKTDVQAEQEGVWLNYGSFRIKVLRAGPTNLAFKQMIEHEMRPHQQAAALGTMPEKLGTEIAARVWARTVITDWCYIDEDGQVHDHLMWFRDQEVPFSPEAAEQLLLDLPELFVSIRTQSIQAARFLSANLEAAAGN